MKFVIYPLNSSFKNNRVAGRTKSQYKLGWLVVSSYGVNVSHELFEASEFSLQDDAPTDVQAVICEESILHICNLVAGPIQI
jgi:hypothetical protein